MKEVTAATPGTIIREVIQLYSLLSTQQHPEQQQVRLSDGLLHVAGEVVLYGGLNLTYKASRYYIVIA